MTANKRRHLHRVRKAAALSGLAARWGKRRAPAKTIRVDADAVAALANNVEERDRREFVSNAIRVAVRDLIMSRLA